MSIDIRVPEFGESVVEATVGRWLKGEGEAVSLGEPVVELETEKVNTTVAADEAGVVATIVHREGETVHPGDVLGTIDTGAVGAAAKPAPKAEPAPEVPAVPEGERRVSPIARRAAAELQVDLERVRGTGPGGRVMKEDVEAVAREHDVAVGERKQVVPELAPVSAPAPTKPDTEQAQPAAAPIAPAPAPAPSVPVTPPPAPIEAEPTKMEGRVEVRQRLSRRRITIARRLVEAHQTAAMLTTFNEIDMQTVVELRKRRRAAFREETGVDLGYMSFFVKATVGALKAFPQLNSELQGDDLVLKRYYDIGVAIGNPEGLVVPVLRDADRLTFAQIEQGIGHFVRKAADRALSLADLQGGTFTITNGGVFGSLFSTPMLNPPQVGILGMHKISDRATVVDGQVVVHPMMFVALTYDHRVIDGRDAVLFLAKIKELIEDPERLLLAG